MRIPVINAQDLEAVFAVARSFNQYVEPAQTFIGLNGPRQGRPGDDYNEKASWEEILAPRGWQCVGERSDGTLLWRRPGKPDPGISATTDYAGSGYLYVFSTNAHPFEFNRAYSKFAAYTLLNFGGDFAAAANDLAAKGYGKRRDSARTQGEKDDDIHLTDLGNATRLIRLRGDVLRYCTALHRWFLWDGTRWVTDGTEGIMREATAVIADLYRTAGEMMKEATEMAAQAATETDEAKREKLEKQCDKLQSRAGKFLKWAFNTESRPRIEALVALARAQKEVVVRPDELDRDRYLLNCPNGTIDLRTGRLRPHRREDLITKTTAVPYDATARAPTFKVFLERIMGGNSAMIDFLQRAFGYSLSGDTSERSIFIFWGTGNNGKSTLLELYRSAIPDYAANTPPRTLMAKRDDAIPNDVARLKGARFVTVIETSEGRYLDVELVKRMTGGVDTLSARFMRAEWFDFVPEFKLFMATNHKPVIRDTTSSIWNRVKLVPFTVTIPDDEIDKELPQKLHAELPGVLAWAVRGCLEWQRKGLGVPPEVSKATSDYRAEMDLIGQFLDECCDQGADLSAPAKDLFGAYKKFAEESEDKVMSQKKFGGLLAEHGFHSDRGGGGGRTRWLGVGLKDNG